MTIVRLTAILGLGIVLGRCITDTSFGPSLVADVANEKNESAKVGPAARVTTQLAALQTAASDNPQVAGASETGERAAIPEEALRQALEALKSVRDNPDDPLAAKHLAEALSALQAARLAVAEKVRKCSELHRAECEHVPPHCVQDACITLRLPPIGSQHARYSSRGIYAMASLLNSAAARGVENATIRALNATQICPDCESQHCGKGSSSKCLENAKPDENTEPASPVIESPSDLNL